MIVPRVARLELLFSPVDDRKAVDLFPYPLQVFRR